MQIPTSYVVRSNSGELVTLRRTDLDNDAWIVICEKLDGITSAEQTYDAATALADDICTRLDDLAAVEAQQAQLRDAALQQIQDPEAGAALLAASAAVVDVVSPSP